MKSRYRNWLLGLLVLAYYALHQDVWLWRTAHPLVFGFLPIGLAYHVIYTATASLLMVVLVRLAWPTHLEKEVEDRQPRSGADR